MDLAEVDWSMSCHLTSCWIPQCSSVEIVVHSGNGKPKQGWGTLLTPIMPEIIMHSLKKCKNRVGDVWSLYADDEQKGY